MMQKSVKWLKGLITVFFITIFTLGFFSKSLLSVTLPNVQVAELNDGVEVNYTSDMTGEIVAKKSADICLKEDALIQEVLVIKGAYVRAGTPLFTVDTSLGASAAADESLLKEQIALEQSRIATMSAQFKGDAKIALQSIQAKIKDAKAHYDKQNQLYDSGAISLEELQLAESTYQSLLTEAQTIENNNQLAEAQNQVAISEIKQRIDQYEKALALHQTDSDRYYDVNANGEVVSKYTGYVTALPEKGRHYQKGELLAVVGVCESYKDLAYEIRVSQKSFNAMSKGSSVINISSLDGEFIGVVAFDYSIAIFDNGQMRVMANFNQEPDIKIYPTMKVMSRTTGSNYIGGEYLAVPRTAIVSSGTTLDGGNALIYLIREEEDALGISQVAVATPVDVVSVGDEYAVVTELRNIPSNKVIINPTARIKDGTKVYVCP